MTNINLKFYSPSEKVPPITNSSNQHELLILLNTGKVVNGYYMRFESYSNFGRCTDYFESNNGLWRIGHTTGCESDRVVGWRSVK